MMSRDGSIGSGSEASSKIKKKTMSSNLLNMKVGAILTKLISSLCRGGRIWKSPPNSSSNRYRSYRSSNGILVLFKRKTHSSI
jgi:hypothetical protein